MSVNWGSHYCLAGFVTRPFAGWLCTNPKCWMKDSEDERARIDQEIELVFKQKRKHHIVDHDTAPPDLEDLTEKTLDDPRPKRALPQRTIPIRRYDQPSYVPLSLRLLGTGRIV